jgi:hypothetical protein
LPLLAESLTSVKSIAVNLKSGAFCPTLTPGPASINGLPLIVTMRFVVSNFSSNRIHQILSMAKIVFDITAVQDKSIT